MNSSSTTIDNIPTPEATAQLLGVDLAQLSHWLRVFLDDGLEALCTLTEGEPSPPTD